MRYLREWLCARALPGVGLLALALPVTGCGEGNAPHASGGGHVHGSSVTPAAHAHDAPGETCFICDASKRDKGRLWCKEHARYEDRCWLCHPEIEDKGRAYCTEHFLYEDECFLCRPELKSGAGAAAQPASTASALFCAEHGVYEAECGICQPDLAKALQPGDDLKVRFPSPDSAGKAGVTTARPRAGEGAATVRVFCEVQHNLNALARVTPLASGVVRAVHADVGDTVVAGEVLVELHSAEAAAVKSHYLSALVELDTQRQSLDRERRLTEQGIGAQKDLLAAAAAHRTAELTAHNLRQQLVNLGFRDDEIAAVEREQDASARLTIRAPFDGTLVERAAVVGEAAQVGDALFTLADLSTRWLMLSIPSRHLGRVHVGQAVSARFPELPGLTVTGEVAWIDSSVDPRSRMVRARAVVAQDAAVVKAGLFGEADVVVGDTRPAVLVPRQAVQRHERQDFVFVQSEPDLFALRRVSLGDSAGDRVEVLAGLGPSDAVVTDGAFIVMSEFLKFRLGAGCADH